LLLIPICGISQNAKLNINKIEIAIYKYNSFYSDIKNKADIVLYCTVDKSGAAQLQYQNDSVIEIYKFDLPENVISDINSFFSEKNGLKSYQEENMPEEGNIYGAQNYNYVRIAGEDNKIESACYLEEFMSEGFNNLMLEITGIYTEKTPVQGAKNIINPAIINQITGLHKRTKRLSKYSGPPPKEEIRN